MSRLFKETGVLTDVPVIAGPCSAENEEQVMSAARALKDIGIRIFRAGVWKPRTKPGGFEGRGSEALKWLRRVKDETGMKVATEVANARHTEEAVDAGIDILWIGARTSANPFAVQEIADTLASLPEMKKEELTVLVKNPVNPDIELWIGAIERLRGAGIRRIGAIHRGFSAYGHSVYRNPPEWRLPIEMKRRMPDLEILCDPSHISGKRNMIKSLSQQALDMNFDGLMIESHCNPDDALSDKEQQVTPGRLGEILQTLKIRDLHSPSGNIEELRGKLDAIDGELLELLARRMSVAREIGQIKRQHNMSVVQPDRYKELMKDRAALAEKLGLGEEFVKRILAAIHEESVRQQLGEK